MKYTILVDEGTAGNLKDVFKDEFDNKGSNKFLIPIYSYVVCKGAIDVETLRNGNSCISDKVLKEKSCILDIGVNLDQATISAINEALHYLISRNYKDNVVVYSDRKGVIDSINSEGRLYKEVETKVKHFKNVRFMWISRKCNTYADKLAYEMKSNIDEDYEISIRKLKELFKNDIKLKDKIEDIITFKDQQEKLEIANKKIKYFEESFEKKNDKCRVLEVLKNNMEDELDYYKKKSDYLELEVKRNIKINSINMVS